MGIGFVRARGEHTGLPVAESADYIAIDFETANSTRGSICAVGVAVVVDSIVVADGSTLVDPQCDFSRYNVAVNGIDDADVVGAPTLVDIWPQLHALLDGQRVIAHYASFDVGALRAGAARYSLQGPTVNLYCTYRLSKRVWPEMPSHGLGFLGPALGLTFDHHAAGADAHACADVARLACDAMSVASVQELAEKLGLVAGRLTPESYEPCNVAGSNALVRSGDGDPDADPGHPLYAHTVCFTGGMFAMTRAEAVAELLSVGGNFKGNVSKKVDYLVIGDADFVAFADGWQTDKLERALTLQAEGKPIEIMAERDFLALLHS